MNAVGRAPRPLLLDGLARIQDAPGVEVLLEATLRVEPAHLPAVWGGSIVVLHVWESRQILRALSRRLIPHRLNRASVEGGRDQCPNPFGRDVAGIRVGILGGQVHDDLDVEFLHAEFAKR